MIVSSYESYPNDPTHLPKWAGKTLSYVRLNVGNPADPRRTRSDFQRAGISLYCNDPWMYEKCYMMIGYYPKSYYHSHNDPRWHAAMNEEFNSLQKNAT